MKVSIQTLDTQYLTTHFKGNISPDDPDKNINELNIYLNENKLNILFEDCYDSTWRGNIIVKMKNQIPPNIYDEYVLNECNIKNNYCSMPLVDDDIETNTLYCYRIFTKFINNDEYYSSFKNIFFIYTYDSDEQLKNLVISAGMILQDTNHKFVTDHQIADWNNKADKFNTYNKFEVRDLIATENNKVVTYEYNGSMSKEDKLKLDNLNNYIHPDTHPAEMITGLNPVATTGDYNYLINKPHLLDESTVSTIAFTGEYKDILHKPKLKSVALSGEYKDLLHKPEIPAIEKGSGQFSKTGTKISIPYRSNTNYVVIIQPSGRNNSGNPNGMLGEIYVDKFYDKFIVYNSGLTESEFDYILYN